MKRVQLAILFVLISCGIACAAKPHHFYCHFSSLDGLPETYISSISQDESGHLWVGTRDGVFYYTGDRFVPFKNSDYLAGCAPHTSSLMLDKEGCIWIVSSRGTGFYDLSSNNFTILDELKEARVLDIDLAPDGIVWLTTSDGIWYYSKQSGSLTKLNTSFSPFSTCVIQDGNLAISSRNDSIYLLNTSNFNVEKVHTERNSAQYSYIEYVGNSCLLASDGLHEVCLIDLDSGKTETLIDSSIIINEAEIRCLLYKDGLYWIGTTYGILIYDPSSHTFEKQFPDERGVATLGARNIYCLYNDSEGNVWAGTFDSGLRGYMAYEEGFSRFISDGTPHSLFGESIRAICDGPDGQIWIGSEEGAFCRFNPESQSFDDYTSTLSVAFGTAITDIARIGTMLWISSYGDGIKVFDPNQCETTRKYSLPDNHVMTILEAGDGSIYAGTTRGLYRLDKATDTFQIIDAVETSFVHSMIEDERGRLIIGTYLHGFGIYDPDTSSYKKDFKDQEDAITSFTFDSRGVLWATTNGSGLCKIEFSQDGNSATVKHINQHSGFPSNSSCSVTEDKEGKLWIATTTGLVEFDPVNEMVLNTYLRTDNIIGGHFAFGSNFMTRDGVIFLGTINGLLMFNPEYIKNMSGNSPLHITDISIGSANVNSARYQKGFSEAPESIRVKQKEAPIISISYSSMSYAVPYVETYDCVLENNGSVSHIVTDENYILYTNLRPGRYHFRVNYENSPEPATEASLNIVILAPWYRSIVAVILYLMLFSSIFYFLFKQKTLQKEKEAQRRIELINATKEKELAHKKMDFYTDIAHEIRTPVSIIQILMDKADSKQESHEELHYDMKAMRQNVDRLKKLCDDLLDFRKMDSKQANLIFVPEDICAIVRKAVNSFESAAKARNLELNTELPNSAITAYCDADAIESVISNLLSNSIKYSSTHIDCKVAEKDGNVVIRVENDGVRVPEEERELIFEAFYQSKNLEKNGTGLGLTYSRKIASLHNGRLYLDPDVKDLNSFVLEIPVRDAQVTSNVADSPSESSAFEDGLTDQPGQKAIILVVEDNEMMRNLIKDSLAPEYEIITACDGEEALGIVTSKRVDLVVSDIMMPKMDGCELCNAIKEDISLSHIPILLLTAAVGVETHIRSLKSGADAYIEKPFKMDVLKANISNLFRNRDIRNEQFSSSPLSHLNLSNISKVEMDFINTLHSYILDHVSESDLSLDRLANAMAVSRSTLNRKVKSDTGMTVNEYVRLCRLKKAAELLAENNYRINEVAYLVGFSSPSYFTLSFQKQFNMLPSEFMKKK